MSIITNNINKISTDIYSDNDDYDGDDFNASGKNEENGDDRDNEGDHDEGRNTVEK